MKPQRVALRLQLGDDGFAKVDPTLEHPRCVYQLLKKHYAGYTPEKVEAVCGTPKEKFLHVCEKLASTAVAGRCGELKPLHRRPPFAPRAFPS